MDRYCSFCGVRLTVDGKCMKTCAGQVYRNLVGPAHVELKSALTEKEPIEDMIRRVMRESVRESMHIHCTQDRLPKHKQYVLVHLVDRPWGDNDDPQGNRFWRVVKFYKGISKHDRETMSGPRARFYHSEDEWGNNQKSYCWKEFGPGTFFGQEIDCWCELPILENR